MIGREGSSLRPAQGLARVCCLAASVNVLGPGSPLCWMGFVPPDDRLFLRPFSASSVSVDAVSREPGGVGVSLFGGGDFVLRPLLVGAE